MLEVVLLGYHLLWRWVGHWTYEFRSMYNILSVYTFVVDDERVHISLEIVLSEMKLSGDMIEVLRAF